MSCRKLSQNEVAEILKVDPSTVKRNWRSVKLKLFETVQACLVGKTIDDLSTHQRVLAFDAVEEELLQPLWSRLDGLTESLTPDEALLVNLIWVWGFSLPVAATVLGEAPSHLQIRWNAVREKLSESIQDFFTASQQEEESSD
ncbi:MAG: hypothetical protein KDB01_27240 [Planctomycetaceae bacterium]|nr:hypothetical protein [Planctomycetaceae bacterium]